MDDFENNVKFGIFESYSHYFGPHSIGCVFPINKAEMIAITMKETILFEGDEIKARARYNFCTGCYIPEVTLIVAHTYRGSELFAMQVNDLTNPILTNFPTDQVGVYHMIYSPKSHAIITIGTGVKVWNISWVDLGKKMFTTNSKVIITLRSTFALTYDSPMLNPPAFDYETERIYLPTPEGIRGFSLDGFPCDLITLLPADTSTIYAFCPQNRKVITSDPVNGVCIWKKGGEIEKRITALGPTILSIGFIDPQNFLYLNASGSLFLVNLKTARPFHCYDSPQMPTRLSIIKLYNRPHITFCIRSEFKLLRVVIPWKVWNLNISRPKTIFRCPKYNCAAQIITQTNNSFIKIYSPQTRRPLVSTTPKEATTPLNFFYDRGTFIEYKYDELSLSYIEQAFQTTDNEPRDYLFVTFSNGYIINYDMSCVPCVELWSSKMNALCIDVIKSPNTDSWLYAIGRSDGGLSLLDYFTFKEIRTISIFKEKICGMEYHYHSNTLVFILENKLQMLDLKSYQVIDSIIYQFTEVCAMHDNIIYLGGKQGEIERFEILNRHFVRSKSDIETKPHTDRVTSFSFAKKHYLSSSIDCTFMLWNYEHEKITLVTVPFPIYSISFLGPKREILLGMDSEVMIMDPTVLFDEIDPEIEIIDNYDRKDDVLDPELLAMKAIQEEEKKKMLIKSLFVNTVQENKKPRNSFRRALLKYQQEQALLQEKGQQLFEKGGTIETPGSKNNQFGDMNNMAKDNNQAGNSQQSKDNNKAEEKKQQNNDSNKENSKPTSNKVKRKKVKKTNNDDEKGNDDNKVDPERALDLLNQMGSNKANQDVKKSTGKKPEVDISKMNFIGNKENNQQEDSQSKQNDSSKKDSKQKQKTSDKNENGDEYDDDEEGDGDEKSKKKSKSKGKSSKQAQQKAANDQKSKQNEKAKEKSQENEKQKQKEAEKQKEIEKQKEAEKQKQKEAEKQKQKQKEIEKQKEAEKQKQKEIEKQKEAEKQKQKDNEKKNAAKTKENNENSSPNKKGEKAEKTQKKQPSPSSKQKSSNSPSSKPQQDSKSNNNATSNKTNPKKQESNPNNTIKQPSNNINTNNKQPNNNANNIKQPSNNDINNDKQPNNNNNNNIFNTKQLNNNNDPTNSNNINKQPNSNTSSNIQQPNSNIASNIQQPNSNIASNIQQPNSNIASNIQQPNSNNNTNINDNNKQPNISELNKDNKTPNITNNNKENNINEIVDTPPNPAIVDENGNVLMSLSVNSEGKPVNDKGDVLDNVYVDPEGNFVNKDGEYVNEKGEPTDPSKKVKYASIASQYDYVTEDGKSIPGSEIDKEIQKEIQIAVEMDRATDDKAKEQIKEFREAYSIDSPNNAKSSQKENQIEGEEPTNEGQSSLIDNNNQNPIKMIETKQEVSRPSTPPPVRWNKNNDNQDNPNALKFEPNNNRRSCRTPPLKKRRKRWQKKEDNLPPPNFVLDPEAILSMFGRGHTELLPLIERMRHDYVAYQTHIAPLPIVVKQGRTFRVMRPAFDASGSNAQPRFLLFPENQTKDNNNNRSYSNFNSDSYNDNNYKNFHASTKIFKPKIYKAVPKSQQNQIEEPKSTQENIPKQETFKNPKSLQINIPFISLDPVNLNSVNIPSNTNNYISYNDDDDHAVSFGPINPRPPSDRYAFDISPHRKIKRLNRNDYTTENQRGFQVKPLNPHFNTNEEEEEQEVNSFTISHPKSARRQRSPLQESSVYDKKAGEDEIKRPRSLRLNRNNGFNELETTKNKSDNDTDNDKNNSDTYNQVIKPPTLRPATIKDYTFLLDPDSASSSSNKMSSTLRDMYPMTTRGPIVNETLNTNKNLYKGGGYLIAGASQGTGLTGISPADLSKSYSMKLTRPSVKKKNSPNHLRKRNALNGFLMQLNEI